MKTEISVRPAAWPIKRTSRRIDEATYPTAIKGRKAEWLAAEYLQACGFYDVELTRVKGPDIIAKKDGREFTIEVKAAFKQTVGNSWLVHIVKPLRRNDDLVALVLPDGRVHVESMSTHLAACKPNGRRTVTKLVLGERAT